ncbi:hypothetical protein EJB05_42289, partial [Eragrostis curvula]
MDNDDARIQPWGLLLSLLLLAGLVLVMAFAIVFPVQVTVDEASLHHFALAAPGNGTPAFTLAYNVSLVVAVHNKNWAMRVRRTAPLDAELRFAGRPFVRVRLAGVADSDRIRPLKTAVYRVATADGNTPPVALGRHAAAELARERAAGAFVLELVVTGELKYQAHPHARSLKVSCPLKLLLSTAPAPAAFAGVQCTPTQA